MSCDVFRQSLLEFGWDESTRQRAGSLLAHMASCPSCQEAAKDFDRLRAALASFRTDAEPPGGWSAFEQRLAARGPHRGVWRLTLMGLAASVLIAGASFQLGRLLNAPATQSVVVAPWASPAPEPSHFAPPQLSHEVKAFDQVSKVFDGRASWMLVSDTSSDVGVAPHPIAATKHVLLLRLTMTRGGRVASDADLLVVPGQTANLTVPLDGGHSLHYRIGTSTGEPTRLSLWLEVNTPQGGEPLAALATKLQVQPGQKMTAGQLATSAGEYELKIGFARADLPGCTQ